MSHLFAADKNCLSSIYISKTLSHLSEVRKKQSHSYSNHEYTVIFIRRVKKHGHIYLEHENCGYSNLKMKNTGSQLYRDKKNDVKAILSMKNLGHSYLELKNLVDNYLELEKSEPHLFADYKNWVIGI